MSRSVTLVTGGTGGLGRAVVARMLERGERVVVPWVVEDEVPELKARLGEAGIDSETDDLALIEADAISDEGLDRILETAAEGGTLRNAVLLVGGFSMDEVADTAPEDWRRLAKLNAESVFMAARHLFPVLRANGGGRIVCVAAHPALDRGAPGMAAYAATKAAVVSLVQSLAKEGGEEGIRVNAVAPDTIDTPANREAMPDADPADWLTPAEIAGVIDFLTSEAGGVVNGAILTLTKQ